MNRSLARGVIIMLMMTQFIALILPQVLNVSYVKAQATRAMRAIDFSTGLNSTSLGNESEPFPAGGLQFTLNITLNGETNDLFGWQISAEFDNNSVRCTGILIPEKDPSYVFYGKQGIAVFDLSGQDTLQEVVAGGVLLNPGDSVSINNVLLCVLNFTVLKVGSFNISFVSGDTFIIDSFNNLIPSATLGFQCSAVGARSKPVAAFNFSPQNPRANQTVTFDGSSSYDPSGQDITLFLWDFGDNTTATNITWSHAYSSNGMYSVNLTVVTTDNVTDSKVISILVGSVPTVAFTYLPIVVVPNDEVIFNASESAGVNSTIISYLWDFGDNVTFLGNTSTAKHRYSSNGVYSVNLTVVDDYGVFNSTSVEIQVGVPPVPLFSYAPPSPIVNDTVTFSAVGSSSIAAYEWDFGEGLDVVETNSSTITHIFYAEENYTITLTVYDIDGLHASYNQTIFILSPSTERVPDYSAQIFLAVVASLIVVILVVRVVRKRLRKKEVALDI
jgi:PKD repeat protein